MDKKNVRKVYLSTLVFISSVVLTWHAGIFSRPQSLMWATQHPGEFMSVAAQNVAKGAGLGTEISWLENEINREWSVVDNYAKGLSTKVVRLGISIVKR